MRPRRRYREDPAKRKAAIETMNKIRDRALAEMRAAKDKAAVDEHLNDIGLDDLSIDRVLN